MKKIIVGAWLAVAAPRAVLAFDSEAKFDQGLNANAVLAAAKDEPAKSVPAVAVAVAKIDEACQTGAITTEVIFDHQGWDDLVSSSILQSELDKTMPVSHEILVTACFAGAKGKGELKGFATAELGRKFAKTGDEGDGDVSGPIELFDAAGKRVGVMDVKGHIWGTLRCHASRGGTWCALHGEVRAWSHTFHAAP